MTGTFSFYNSRFYHRFHIILHCTILFSNDIRNLFLRQRWFFFVSHATTEYNYGMAADIYDKKYNVTKCNQTFEHNHNVLTFNRIF